MENSETIVRQALELPLDKRAELAARLLKSLDELTDDEAQNLWAKESERRLDDLKSGKARSVPADKVLLRAESLIE